MTNREPAMDPLLRLAALIAIAVLLIVATHFLTAPAVQRNRQRIMTATVSDMLATHSGFRGEAALTDGTVVSDGTVSTDGTIVAVYRRESDGLSVARVRHTDPLEFIDILVGVEPDGRVFDLRMLERGFRAWAGERGVLDSLIGMGGENPVARRKFDLPLDRQDAISGATITYETIAGMVERASTLIRRQP